jgi:hypothetical protein
MALAITNRMSSPRRDTTKDSDPHRDPAHGGDEELELKLLSEFRVESSTRAEVQTFSPLAIQSPGNLFGDTSDPTEPNMEHESNMMPEPCTYFGNDFFPPYTNHDPPAQFTAYQQQIRSQFPSSHHAGDHPSPPSPPHYAFDGGGYPPEPIRGHGAFMYPNDGMHGSYEPHPSREHYNYLRSFNSFDAPAFQFDPRDVPHNHAVVSDVYGYDRFPLHTLHANGNGFQFPQADESMDQKPAALNLQSSPAMYSQNFSLQAPTLPTYPTQDANAHRLKYPLYARPFKASPTEPIFHSLEGHQPQENLKPTPKTAATSAAVANPTVRRNTRRTINPPRGQNKAKHTVPAKETPLRRARTRKKTYRAAPTTSDMLVSRGTARSSDYTSPSGMHVELVERQSSPTPQELEEARTPRKQDALVNWFQRLNDLRQFKEENGHSRCQSSIPVLEFCFLVPHRHDDLITTLLCHTPPLL